MSRDCRVALPLGAMGCLQFVIVVFSDHTYYFCYLSNCHLFSYELLVYFWKMQSVLLFLVFDAIIGSHLHLVFVIYILRKT